MDLGPYTCVANTLTTELTHNCLLGTFKISQLISMSLDPGVGLALLHLGEGMNDNCIHDSVQKGEQSLSYPRELQENQIL